MILRSCPENIILLSMEDRKQTCDLILINTVFPDTGSRSPHSIINFIFAHLSLHLIKLLRLSKEYEKPVEARQILEELITRRIIQPLRAIIFKRKHAKDTLNFSNRTAQFLDHLCLLGKHEWTILLPIQATKCKGQRTSLTVKEMQVINTMLGKPFYMLELFFLTV